MTPLTESVCEKIDALFPPESREAARKLIEEKCGGTLPLSNKMGPAPSGFDRIRFAVLKLSRGDLIALEREITAANNDWRDTLMAAGFGEDLHAHLRWSPKPLA